MLKLYRVCSLAVFPKPIVHFRWPGRGGLFNPSRTFEFHHNFRHAQNVATEYIPRRAWVNQTILKSKMGVHNDDINDVKPLEVSSLAKWLYGDESNSSSMI